MLGVLDYRGHHAFPLSAYRAADQPHLSRLFLQFTSERPARGAGLARPGRVSVRSRGTALYNIEWRPVPARLALSTINELLAPVV
jgi:hypothetical protein